jgi:hypothetical protein
MLGNLSPGGKQEWEREKQRREKKIKVMVKRVG